MTVLITLITAGADSGPFNLYSDADGFTSAFETGVSKASLLSGYSSALVPDATTIIRVMSDNMLCTNYIDLELYPSTTTTTTLAPLDFLLSYECADEIVTVVTASTITGGLPDYFAADTFFYDEASALANTSWSLFPIDSISYSVGEPNNTFWVVIKDSAGNITANSITTACSTTTTTTTLAPLDFVISSSCDGSGNGTINIDMFTGGSGVYEVGSNFFLSEAAALANGSWIPSTSFAIGVGPAIGGTYWMVIRDSLGNILAKDIVVNCIP